MGIENFHEKLFVALRFAEGTFLLTLGQLIAAINLVPMLSVRFEIINIYQNQSRGYGGEGVTTWQRAGAMVSH